MKKNVGLADKGIRVLVAFIIAVLYYLDIISGTIGIVFMAIAIILLLTSVFNFCPLYALLGKNTCKIK